MTRRWIPVLVAVCLVCAAPARDGQAGKSVECGAPSDIGDGWQLGTQAAVGLDAARLCALVDKLAGSPKDNVHGVVVARDGRLVFEHYLSGPDQRWGEVLGTIAHGPDLKHDVRSVSKSVTSLLVGIALDRQLIASIDEPVFGFFPAYADLRTPEKERILMRHLLAMTSGIAWDEMRPYSDPKNSEIQMIRRRTPTAMSSRSLWPPPRTRSGTTVAGRPSCWPALSRKWRAFRSRSSPARLCSDRSESRTIDWVRMPNGETAAASGLRLRPRDMAKIGQLLLNGGEWGGRRIVSA